METLEEAAKSWVYDKPESNYHAFIAGAKRQQERMYSEEDMIKFMQFIISQETLDNTSAVSEKTAKYYLEQFKKK